MVSTTTQEMQQVEQQVRGRLDGIRGELDRIEQSVRFDQQTSGYPQGGLTQHPQQLFDEQMKWALVEISKVRDKTEAFALYVREKVDQITTQMHDASTSKAGYAQGGSGYGSVPSWAPSLIQAVRETIDVTQQALFALQSSKAQQRSP